MITSFMGLCRKLILTNKVRMMLSILGVALAVGLIVSMFSLFNKMEEAFKQEVIEMFGKADILVGYEVDTGQYINEEQEEKIRSLPNIKGASEILVLPNNVRLRDSNGGGLYDATVYTVGTDNDFLAKSRYKFSKDIGENEVVVTSSLAEELKANISDKVYIDLPGKKPIACEIIEIIPAPKGAVVPDVAIFNIQSLQKWMNLENKFTYMLLETMPDANKLEVSNMLREADDKLRIEIIEMSDYVKRNTQHIKNTGYGLGLLSLVISALLVISNFRIFVYESQRELAVIRALGGSISQTYQLILIQAAFIVLSGGMIGLGLGVLCSTLLASFFGSLFGVNITATPYNLGYAIILSMISLLAIMLMLLFPAFRSAKIPPIQSIQENDRLDFNKGSIRKKISLACMALGITIIAVSGLMEKTGGAVDGFFGGLLIVIGLFIGVTYFIKPLLTFLLPVCEFFGGREVYVSIKNIVPQVRQNSLVVLALAGSVMIAVTGASILESVKENSIKIIRQEYVSDIVLSSRLNIDSELELNFSKKVESIRGVKKAIPYGRDTGGTIFFISEETENRIPDSYGYIVADLDALSSSGFLPPLEGDTREMTVLNKEYAKILKLKVGDEIRVVNYNRKNKGSILKVAAIVDNLPGYWYNTGFVDIKNTEIHDDFTILGKVLIVAEKDMEGEVLQGLHNLKAYYPEIKWSTLEEALEETNMMLEQRFALLNIVVFISSFIGLCGMVITLRTQIQARRREYAVLRAISITPLQLFKIVLAQSLLYSMIGITVGSMAGIAVASGFLIGDSGGIVFPWKTMLYLFTGMTFLGLLFTVPMAKSICKKSITEELARNVG